MSASLYYVASTYISVLFGKGGEYSGGFRLTSDEILAVVGDVAPLWPGELVLTAPDPPLHPGGDGLAVMGVERRVTTDPKHISFYFLTVYFPCLFFHLQ